MTSYLLASPRCMPVSLGEARQACGISGREWDGMLGIHIMQATLEVERDHHVALITQKWQWVMNEWPEDLTVQLPYSPVSAVLVRYYPPILAEEWHAPIRARPYVPEAIDSDRGIVKFPESCRRIRLRQHHAVEINYVCGYGPAPRDVPTNLRMAVLREVARRYEISQQRSDPFSSISRIDRMV